MKISTLIKQGILIVRVEGEMDMHAADEFRNIVDSALEASGVKNILLNLKDVTFIDSSGLGVILGRYKKVNMLGGRLTATNVRPQVIKIFQLSGMLKIMNLYSSETEALQYL